jgi:hypothetical protein
MPPGAAKIDKWNWFLFLVIGARGKSVALPSQAQTWLASLSALLYPTLILPLNGVALQLENIDAAFLAKIRAAIDAYKNLDSARSKDAKGEAMKISVLYSVRELPSLGFAESSVGNFQIDFQGAYAYYGLVCATIQKDASRTGWEALSKNRPRALISKYGWSVDQYPYIGGSYSYSQPAAMWMRRQWMLMSQMRRALFTYFCSLGTLDTSAADESLFTTVRLMRWTDLSHIAIIYRFLTEHPIAAEAPVLTPHVAVYHTAVQQLIQWCPDVKDSAGAPVFGADGIVQKDTSALAFVKIFYYDKGEIAPRKIMEPLLQVAGAFLTAGDALLAGYSFPTGYTALVADVQRHVREYNTYSANEDKLLIAKQKQAMDLATLKA